MSWWCGKGVIREYLEKVNETENVNTSLIELMFRADFLLRSLSTHCFNPDCSSTTWPTLSRHQNILTPYKPSWTLPTGGQWLWTIMNMPP